MIDIKEALKKEILANFTIPKDLLINHTSFNIQDLNKEEERFNKKVIKEIKYK